ncbi:MAG: response regulator transcription factor [Treponema sp.]|jgi:DNA-binding NarL/FixJ family response regulator|nr:response regulator transcription factor [Treponema sp.]
MISIIVVDKEEDRHALGSVLMPENGIQISAFGRDEYDALRLVDQKKPDAALISIDGEGEGADLVPLLKRRSPHTAIIMYTPRGREEAVWEAVSAGVSGYLVKPDDRDRLPEMIKIACFGGCYISPNILGQTRAYITDLIHYRRCVKTPPGGGGAPSIPSGISNTELRVMGCIGRAQSNKEIAEQLQLTQGTVRNYVSSAMKKAGLQNRTQIAIYALKNGLTKIG